MTTSTEDIKAEVEAGLNEETVITLTGDDLSQLTQVTEEDDSNDDVGSTESFKTSSVANDNDCNCAQQQEQQRPCVSRVIDANGNAKCTVVLGSYERHNFVGTVVSILDSASENDVVDITVVSTGANAGTVEYRSILSAIDRCRGTVITRAGALTTLGDVAIWLAGDVRKMSPIGCVLVRQPISGYCGDAADHELRLSNFRDAVQEFASFIVETGFFTEKEIDDMYEHRGLIALYGDNLKQRLANLKTVTH